MPKVVEDREGRRCTSNAILFEQDNVPNVELLGTLAWAKRFETRGIVLNPHDLLWNQPSTNYDDHLQTNVAVRHVVESAARNALEQTLGEASSLSEPLLGGAYQVAPWCEQDDDDDDDKG
eukprot:scaffold1332_cov42-Attheya_sp.AAC.4